MGKRISDSERLPITQFARSLSSEPVICFIPFHIGPTTVGELNARPHFTWPFQFLVLPLSLSIGSTDRSINQARSPIQPLACLLNET